MTSPIHGMAAGTENAPGEIIPHSPYNGLCGKRKARNDIVFRNILA
ncbi:hypothetical protein MBUL_03770 [Methylobacterium bullatum]|uniref:Uncharacterized protein n=1 Tax=Methylobacterium bullatum TaxID=570505 RepID=A0A679JK71_9HYPH|nr:hypothetical protein MBUL_03770 [Methylobacterium bullatum]